MQKVLNGECDTSIESFQIFDQRQNDISFFKDKSQAAHEHAKSIKSRYYHTGVHSLNQVKPTLTMPDVWS